MRRCRVHDNSHRFESIEARKRFTLIYLSPLHFSIAQSIDASRSPRQESKISLFVYRRSFPCFVRDDKTLWPFYRQTRQHGKSSAQASNGSRDPLTTRCHSRVPDHLDADCLQWKLHFFLSFFRDETIFTIFIIFVRTGSGSDKFARVHASEGSHAFRSSPVIAERIEATATGNEAIPDVTTYVVA